MATDWPSQLTGEPRNQYRPAGGMTPLLYAARSGCTDCVQALLDAGANVNQPNPDGVTPLMVAIDNFAFDTAKLLYERGANPHVWDWWGRTALYTAIDMNTYSLDAYEERTGPPIVTTKTTALELARMFLDAGVDPNTQLNMHRPGRGGNSGRFADEIIYHWRDADVARRSVARQRGRAAVAQARRARRRAQRDGRDAADGRRGAGHGIQPAL